MLISWTQIGNEIYGEVNDSFGRSISLSSDGSIVAIAARGSNSSSGRVQVYKYNGGSWTQMGSDINGKAAGNYLGSSVSLSSDGNIVAIGAPYSNANGLNNSGHVRIFGYDGSDWTQMGPDIQGEAAGDYLGVSVSLSIDGGILAIGSPYSDEIRNNEYVRVYKYNGGSWIKMGHDININGIEGANNSFGENVSLSSDGSIVAISAKHGNANGLNNSGLVQVYEYNGSTWTQMVYIDGEAPDIYFGWSLSLSSDGSIVAIGASYTNANGLNNSGRVQVYEYNNVSNTWTQMGNNIDGQAPTFIWVGVPLSSDGSIVAIGAPYYSASGYSPYPGQVQVHKYNNVSNTWIKMAQHINGENDNSGCGESVSSLVTVV